MNADLSPDSQSPLDEEWVEVRNADGKFVGYLTKTECRSHGLRVDVAVSVPRWKEDPYVATHAIMAFERGLLSGGQDLNSVQMVLLQAYLIRKREEEERLREQDYQRMIGLLRPEQLESYQARQRADEAQQREAQAVEQRVTLTPQDFFRDLAAWAEEEDDEDEPGGIQDFLTDDEIAQMGDGED